MEKRKARILQQLNSVSEEKNTVLENLNILLHQVTSCSDYAQTSKDSAKHLEIVTYELDIIKKLTELNFELEQLAASCPIGFQELQDVEELTNVDTTLTSTFQTAEEMLSISSNGHDEASESNFDIREEHNFTILHNDIHSEQNRIDSIEQTIDITGNHFHEVYEPHYEKKDFEVPVRDMECPNSALMKLDSYAENKKKLASEYLERQLISPDIKLTPPPESCETLESNKKKKNKKKKKDNSFNVIMECPNSALIKLDSYAENKKKLASEYLERQLISPDIKLTPAPESCETLESNNKKKNKKKKKDNSFNVIMELKPKKYPSVGDLCVFSHVESPSEFYIQVVDEETAAIDTFEAAMNRYFRNSVSAYDSKEMAFQMIRDFGCVYIQKSERWSRCRILEWNLAKKTNTVLVHLVDYGNKEITSYKNLRRITKEFADLPILAIRCYFPLLYPPGSTHLNRKTQWPQESIEALANLSLLYEPSEQCIGPFTIQHACSNDEEQTLAVDLLSEHEKEKTLGQILLDLRFAEQLVESIDENNLEVEVFTQDMSTLEFALNINEAVYGYDPKDEARICRFTRKDGTCFKGKNCKLEHTKLSKDGITTDKEPVFTAALYDLVLPLQNEIVSIFITGYLDICNFYAQIIRTPYFDPEKNYMMDLSMYNLLTEMNSTNIIRLYEPYRLMPAIGEAVIVHNYWSSQWLRGILTSCIDDEQNEFSVFTVDFGESIKAKLTDLRKMKEQFLKLPFQAVRCYMSGYRMGISCDAQIAEDFFYENLYCRNFIGEVLSSHEPLKMKLQSQTGQDVGKTLLDAGYVEKCSDDTHMKGNFILSQ